MSFPCMRHITKHDTKKVNCYRGLLRGIFKYNKKKKKYRHVMRYTHTQYQKKLENTGCKPIEGYKTVLSITTLFIGEGVYIKVYNLSIEVSFKDLHLNDLFIDLRIHENNL